MYMTSGWLRIFIDMYMTISLAVTHVTRMQHKQNYDPQRAGEEIQCLA